MSERGRDMLIDKIWQAIRYVAKEFDMDYGETAGCLSFVHHSLMHEADEARAKEEEEEDK